jgi:2-polyprenyl-3-methyl-5-hydroxy-6-metoxy-1,4-benzoquinol methylase
LINDKNKQAVEVFNKLAQSYQDKFMDVSLYHDSFDVFCSHIKKEKASVLELACGPGNITQYLLKKRPDLNILGTDLAPNMIELAKINNPQASFQLLDSRAITSLNKTYDAIMCGFCLPYLSKEEAIQLIADSAKVLTSDGVIYISTMEDDYSKSEFKKGSSGDEIFMHYHQADYLTEALIKNNFKIVKLLHQDYPTTDGTKVVDLIIIAQK